MSSYAVVEKFRIEAQPNYVSQSNEEQVFAAAFRAKIPLILKGPTGCGKTRFVEYIAHTLGVPLITVSCHEDLTASDLLGRFLFRDNETVWQDGPLTLAVRYGGICYLDEIVEARKDTTVVIHSLTDHRRTLYIDKTGELIHAHPDFMMVLSYNPGYQSIVKDLKQSTKQRFASLVFDHPPVELEREIIHTETGLDRETSTQLAEMGAKIRELQGFGLEEGVSSRLLVYVGRLMQEGLDAVEASTVAVAQTLTDDSEVLASVRDVIQLYFGELMELPDATAQPGRR
jgi:nitric oxide reductase NorQ protein